MPVAAGDRVEELDRLRVRIAQNMRAAKDTAAHVFTSIEVDFEKVEQVRQRHKADFKASHGVSLTYLPFIVRAAVDALRSYPAVNSSFHLDEGTRTLHGTPNIGIAVDTQQAARETLERQDRLGVAAQTQARIDDPTVASRSEKIENLRFHHRNVSWLHRPQPI